MTDTLFDLPEASESLRPDLPQTDSPLMLRGALHQADTLRACLPNHRVYVDHVDSMGDTTAHREGWALHIVPNDAVVRVVTTRMTIEDGEALRRELEGE